MEGWACGEAAVPDDGISPDASGHVGTARIVSDSHAFSLHPILCYQTNLTIPSVVP